MFEMTMEEVNDCFVFMGIESNPKKLSDWLFVGRKQDLGWLEKNRIGKVKRGNLSSR